MAVTKEQLLKPRLPEGEVDVPSVGTVRVRGLSRGEVLEMRGLPGPEFEVHMVAAGMVDPELTIDESREWQRVALAGEIEPVVLKVTELSGLNPGAAKETYKELASDSDAEFRDVPGGPDGDDGGAAPDGDVER